MRAERLHRRNVTGEYIGDLSLGYSDQRIPVDPVHEDCSEVNATAQKIRGIAGFTIQRYDRILERASEAPPFFHNGDLIGVDDADAEDLCKDQIQDKYPHDYPDGDY